MEWITEIWVGTLIGILLLGVLAGILYIAVWNAGYVVQKLMNKIARLEANECVLFEEINRLNADREYFILHHNQRRSPSNMKHIVITDEAKERMKQQCDDYTACVKRRAIRISKKTGEEIEY